jgi:hypothetical protein
MKRYSSSMANLCPSGRCVLSYVGYLAFLTATVAIIGSHIRHIPSFALGPVDYQGTSPNHSWILFGSGPALGSLLPVPLLGSRPWLVAPPCFLRLPLPFSFCLKLPGFFSSFIRRIFSFSHSPIKDSSPKANTFTWGLSLILRQLWAKSTSSNSGAVAPKMHAWSKWLSNDAL